MANPDILLMGNYNAEERTSMGEYFTLHDSVPNDPASIDGIAFKGHGSLTADVMDSLPNLKIIANYGVGYDTIDVAGATARGIRVTNTPDVLTDDVADLAVGMLIASARQFLPADQWVRSGDWGAKGDFRLLNKVTGARVGIVGLGRIGRGIADRLTGFSMDISYTSRAAKDTPGWTHYTDPATMAAEVDYLVIALSGGPDTADVINKAVLDALGPDGTLINVSRGSTVDEDALIDALQNNRIRAAALDVYKNEPTPDKRFLALDNVLLQPHQASATYQTRAAMAFLQRDNLRAQFDGTPLLTPVN